MSMRVFSDLRNWDRNSNSVHHHRRFGFCVFDLWRKAKWVIWGGGGILMLRKIKEKWRVDREGGNLYAPMATRREIYTNVLISGDEGNSNSRQKSCCLKDFNVALSWHTFTPHVLWFIWNSKFKYAIDNIHLE